jgi:hypothetical protein
LTFETFEPRLLLSADALGAATLLQSDPAQHAPAALVEAARQPVSSAAREDARVDVQALPLNIHQLFYIDLDGAASLTCEGSLSRAGSHCSLSALRLVSR